MADVTCVNGSGQTTIIRLADDSPMIEVLEELHRRGDLADATVGSKSKPKAASKVQAK